MYRLRDLLSLESFYSRKSNDFVICYGNNRSGLTSLIKSFADGKECFYFKVPDSNHKLSEEIFLRALNNNNNNYSFFENDYERLLQAFLEDGNTSKKIIVFDDFTNLFKDSTSYINLIFNLVSEKISSGKCLFLFLSCDENWIENEMLNTLGKRTYEFSGIIHVGGMTLSEVIEAMPLVDRDRLFRLYSVIGGNCLLWSHVDVNYDIKELCLSQLLNTSSLMFSYTNSLIPSDIRQSRVYNTILFYLAEGHNKLNALSLACGMDRNRLIVYINSLIRFKLVYKADSIELGKKSNIQKGIYKISDPFVRFYYYFIYPNLSLLYYGDPADFYKRIVLPRLDTYLSEYYMDYCIYYIKHLKGDNNIQDIDFIQKYLDKNGTISFIICLKNNENIIASCQNMMSLSLKDFDNIKSVAHKNKIPFREVFMFSAKGFDKKLLEFALNSSELRLFELPV